MDGSNANPNATNPNADAPPADVAQVVVSWAADGTMKWSITAVRPEMLWAAAHQLELLGDQIWLQQQALQAAEAAQVAEMRARLAAIPQDHRPRHRS